VDNKRIELAGDSTSVIPEVVELAGEQALLDEREGRPSIRVPIQLLCCCVS
jgi:hypothetical protein